nr:PREDICTED: ubiquitin carboxyl-terminal hydrolase FAM188A-like isoform X2 [Bemisia tabaci]
MQYFSEEHEFPGTIVRTESPIYGFLMHGFNFSPDEPTALIQWEGGPCAVLAPVQAFILKSLVNSPSASNWQQVRRNENHGNEEGIDLRNS